MKKRTMQTKVKKIGIFFYACTLVNVFAASQDESDNIAQDLSMLFSYKKAAKNKQTIANHTNALPTNIGAILKETYDKKTLKEALGNLAPTATDEYLLKTFQWAYVEGTASGLNDRIEAVNTGVDQTLLAVFSAWRKSGIKSTIEAIQDELSDKVKNFITDAKTIDKTNFQDIFGYKSNEKDLAYLRSLRWAYQCGVGNDPEKVQDEDNEPAPIVKETKQDDGINNAKEIPSRSPKKNRKNNKNNRKKKNHKNNPQGRSLGETPLEEDSPSTPLYITCGSVVIIIVGTKVYQRMKHKAPIKRRKNKQSSNEHI